MLDIVGAMTLAPLATLLAGTLILNGTGDGTLRVRLALGAVIWFTGIATLAASGAFTQPAGRGTLAIGAAVLVPILLGLAAIARSRTAREFAWGVPLAVLVGVHAGRLLGVFFLALHSAGRLPPTFALSAGWGDIVVGFAALPLAWAIHRRVPGWQGLTLAWNAVAMLDLVTAVSLGVGSAPDSPLRFIFETPSSGAIATLPWAMIPGFLVPLFMLTHLVVFARLAAKAPADQRTPLRSAA
jgi:hypothetical protein